MFDRLLPLLTWICLMAEINPKLFARHAGFHRNDVIMGKQL